MAELKLTGIYKIESLIHSDRCYIGSAFFIDKRWQLHLTNLKANKHHSIILQNHFNKYGIEDLMFSIIEECDRNDLIKKEQYYIDSLKPYFNVCQIVNSRLNLKHSESTKKKISQSHIGIKPNEDTRLKLSIAQRGNKKSLGHKCSELSKQKTKEKNTGRKWSNEHKLEHSLRMKGENNPFYGKKHTQETKDKIRNKKLLKVA